MARASLIADVQRLHAPALVHFAHGLEKKPLEAGDKLYSLQGDLKAVHTANAQLEVKLKEKTQQRLC